MGEKQAMQALELLATLVNALTDLEKTAKQLLKCLQSQHSFVDSGATSLERIARSLEDIQSRE